MKINEIIENKRDKKALTREEIEYFVSEYTNGNIKDYHASALLMAIYLNGMSQKETLDLTRAMVDSGDKFNLKEIDNTIIDKHSTGGIGDTVTLILGPMIAACNLPFAKMSGRGLGYSGGTIDKLEAIPGLKLNLEYKDFINNVKNINLSICSQTGNIAPADKKIYALRDVTATVGSIPLIASSIMSKKLAIEGDGIILDVKVGSGAFMKNISDAKKLAKTMISIGKGYGREVVALITNMDEPLGNAIGNNLEVIEAIETLKGKGPSDLFQLSIELGIEVLLLSKTCKDREEAKYKLLSTIEDGSALNKFIEMVELQGGDSSYIKNTNKLKRSNYSLEIFSGSQGYISKINAENIGKASLVLGAGRENLDTEIDLTAGIYLDKKVGDYINNGDRVCTIYTNDETRLSIAKNIISSSIDISKDRISKDKILIYDKLY